METEVTPILIVDANWATRKHVLKICKDFGFTEVYEAENAARAWEIIAEAPLPFSLIVAELTLPVETGMELLDKLRNDLLHADTPVIAMSKEGDPELVRAAAAAGVRHYLLKPFSVDLLRDELKALRAYGAAKEAERPEMETPRPERRSPRAA